MKRRAVKVIKSRLEDIEVGDVVNRSPDAESGWFTVEAITTLFNGHLQLADVTEQLTVSGDHKDMVGLQLVEEIQLDDRGLVAPSAPAVVTTAPLQPLGAVPAAPVATEGPSPLPAGSHVPAGVNLAVVAELLEDLELGDAPLPDAVMPSGAQPVHGTELPATPSYENPVVVPDEGMLPRRNRAA